MIKEFDSLNRTYSFYDDADIERNIFTVIVGKNGSGKSTLLGSLARSLLAGKRSKLIFSGAEIGKGKFQLTKRPSQIIAVSTSPFDKFPLPRRLEDIQGYTYLGLRDLHASNFGLAYLSKIIAGLIDSVQRRPEQASEISKVLNYLGYHGTIRMRFGHLATSTSMLKSFLKLKDPITSFQKNEIFTRRLNRRFFYDQDENLDEGKVVELTHIVSRLLDAPLEANFQLEINDNGLDFHRIDSASISELTFLLQSGVLRLRDVGLQRLSDSSLFSIKDASSGEQSVILGFLGIASQIKDNSLICIDEPEICLHPQWQERYIQLLISTFSNYRGCQFIIATHSPQIISRLQERNCYILSMERGQAINASLFIKNSIDFQLARLFDSPGYKNEYLSRIALNIFSKVSKSKTFDEHDRETLRLLEYQSNFLDQKDPVYELYISLKELLNIYG